MKSLKSINAPDGGLIRMYQYSIDSILFSKSPLPVDLFSGSSNKLAKYRYNRILQINDSIFVGMGGLYGGRFTIFNRYNKDFYSFGKYPDEVSLSNGLKSEAYQGNLIYNEYNQNIVFAESSSELLEFYHFEKNKMQLQKGYYTSIPNYSLVNKGGENHIISSLHGRNIKELTYTKNYVYVLYVQKEDDASLLEKSKGDCILVFDWKGKPIKRYQLDCEVKTITINEDGSRIYALWDNPDPEIIYFDIDSKNQN